MCGIAGYWNASGKEADPEILRKMADTMKLRGPDGEGFFRCGPLGLAHRRLSVIDLEGGAQPMSVLSGRLTVVFNGEIFNYRELRKEMERNGFGFRTMSDTEAIPALYAAEGASSVRRLNGFFAFCLYDREADKLLLARDRAGVKPLFCLKCKEGFAFASTLNALKQVPFFDPDPDPESIADFLAFQYVPGNRTAFRNVFRLPPGHILTFDLKTGEFQIESFADKPVPKTEISYRDAACELRRLMEDAVERRLVADVPLGVFLSGGLDSAIVSGLAAKLLKKPLECFSIGFGDPAYDESALAAEAAGFIRTFASVPVNSYIRKVDPCDFELLRFMAHEFGEPYADASLLPTSLLCRETRKHVTVALSGDGADELFGGYDRYRAMELLRKLPLPRPLCRLLADWIPAGGERSRRGRLRRFLLIAALPPEKRYRFLMTHGADELLAASAGPRLRNAADPDREFPVPDSRDPEWFEPELDLHTYLPGDVLTKVDVCSMSASLEVRSPFLDHRIVSFAASLPADWKRRGAQRKRILCDAFADILPPGLASRKKRGFGVPLAAWFRSEWNAMLREHLLSGTLDGWIRRDETEKLLVLHEQGKQDVSYWLFSLLMLALFLEDAY